MHSMHSNVRHTFVCVVYRVYVRSEKGFFFSVEMDLKTFLHVDEKDDNE